MRIVNSRQYIVDRRGIKFVLFAFSLFTIYCLLSTTAFAQSVDLLWQGETYVSPFYRGRALWSNQSIITFVVIPQGLGSAADLNYKWTKNGTVLGNINGVGRNTLSFTDSVLSRPQTIRVDILSSDQSVLASASTVVVPIPPTLAIYENNPLYGFMFHREMGGTYELKEREVTFTAFPLFFSASNRMDETIEYEWRTNVGATETRNSVTYRAPEGISGTSQVQIQASNIGKIMQNGRKDFLVQF